MQKSIVEYIEQCSTRKAEKHQGRRFPDASAKQAFFTRRSRVSLSFTPSIQLIKSLRASGVKSFHTAFAFGLALSAVYKFIGTIA